MNDYLSLEKMFKKLRQGIIKYRDLLEKNKKDGPSAEGRAKEDLQRSKLTQKYGSLAGYIHGMAGYVEQSWGGKPRDIFMTAFLPYSDGQALTINWGIASSIQCLDKAIGGCQYARSTTVERKANQILIHKGAIIGGSIELINILKQATKCIFIRDRYVDAELISMLDTLPSRINIKILIMSELYKEKPTLKIIYKKYCQQKSNIEIREIPRGQFHSREIIIDQLRAYELTFSIKDIGRSDGNIFILDEQNKNVSLANFNNDWKAGISI